MTANVRYKVETTYWARCEECMSHPETFSQTEDIKYTARTEEQAWRMADYHNSRWHRAASSETGRETK